MSEQELIEMARSTPRESLPALIGTLARAQAEANARLLTPTPVAKVTGIDEWMDTDGAREFLKCSKSFLYHSARHGLHARRVGRKLVFSKRELEAYLNQGMQNDRI